MIVIRTVQYSSNLDPPPVSALAVTSISLLFYGSMPSAWLGISAMQYSASPVSARRRSVPWLLPPFPCCFMVPCRLHGSGSVQCGLVHPQSRLAAGQCPGCYLHFLVVLWFHAVCMARDQCSVRSSASPVSDCRWSVPWLLPPFPCCFMVPCRLHGSGSVQCGLVHPQSRLAAVQCGLVHPQSRLAAGQCPGCYLHFVVLWFHPSAARDRGGCVVVGAVRSSIPVSARRRSVPRLLPPFPRCFMVPCRLHGSGSVQCGLVHPQSRLAVVSARRRSVPRLLPPFPCCFMVPCRLHGSGSVQCAV
ncbi:hypothetical protein J6590_002804 [Homalodisca vitripennis]|nr:hypothetical protein J6590_002804 [Homalodisca vitripennis]